MKTILLLLDSLNRHMLPAYGCPWVRTPNIDRLAARSVVYDNHWLGSAPCMPARRDILTGRLSFLERSWGPIEPFDVPLPLLLRRNGVFTHMATDHYHYFETGGEGYCQQFHTWDFIRGQEWDPWVSRTAAPELPDRHYGRLREQYEWNKTAFRTEADYPSPKTLRSACDWLDRNHDAGDFFLMLDVFDPHEPFDCPAEYLALYGDDYTGPRYDWPNYGPVDVPEDAVRHIRNRYAATLTLTDHYIGKLLDTLDTHNLWDDTLLILTTDHGHMLGEHGFMAKSVMHLYNELAHLPLMVHWPGGKRAGERYGGLTQNIDLMPTILAYHGIQPPPNLHGRPLESGRETALFGYFGKTVNITDGRYTYFAAPARGDNTPCYLYAAMPVSFMTHWGMDTGGGDSAHLSAFQVSKDAMLRAGLGRFLPHTEYPVYKIPFAHEGTSDNSLKYLRESLLFDIAHDYPQAHPIDDAALIAAMRGKLAAAMRAIGAPEEQFTRLGL